MIRTLTLNGHKLTIAPVVRIDGEACNSHVDPTDGSAVVGDDGDRDHLAAHAFAAGAVLGRLLADRSPAGPI